MKLNEALNILKDAITYGDDGEIISGKSWILSTNGIDAIKTVLNVFTRLNDDIQEFDFQGWPVNKKTVRDFIEILNPIIDKTNKQYIIDSNNPILDTVPTILEDDGMGYGANSGKLNGIEKSDSEIRLWF